MPELSLLTKFTIVSLVITAAIGIALAWGIQQQMEYNALQNAAEDAADNVATLLNPNLHQADLSGPLDTFRFAQVDTLIRQSVLNDRVVRVKIWNRDGVLIYCVRQIVPLLQTNSWINLGDSFAGKIAVQKQLGSAQTNRS